MHWNIQADHEHAHRNTNNSLHDHTNESKFLQITSKGIILIYIHNHNLKVSLHPWGTMREMCCPGHANIYPHNLSNLHTYTFLLLKVKLTCSISFPSFCCEAAQLWHYNSKDCFPIQLVCLTPLSPSLTASSILCAHNLSSWTSASCPHPPQSMSHWQARVPECLESSQQSETEQREGEKMREGCGKIGPQWPRVVVSLYVRECESAWRCEEGKENLWLHTKIKTDLFLHSDWNTEVFQNMSRMATCSSSVCEHWRPSVKHTKTHNKYTHHIKKIKR